MVKRIYFESLKKWLIASGISVGTLVGGLFLYLNLLGVIEITGHSGDMICAGTLDDPCYAYINLTAKEDVFIYPVGYDPWGRDTFMEFAPGVKDWKLQRSWGSGWRDIPLDKTCTGTWCGAPNNLGVKYSYVLREGRDYRFRIVVYKNSPYDTIKWAVNYDDKEYLDPVWDNEMVNKTIEKKLKNKDYQNYLRTTDSFRIEKDGKYKSYNSSEKRLKIEDKDFNLLVDMKLESDYKVSGLIASEDTKVAELMLIDWKNEMELFDLVNYFDKKNDFVEIDRVFRYKWENITGEECFGSECFNITNWIEFKYLDELPHKKIKISLWTNTFINENIEWVLTIEGFECLEWAEWDISSASFLQNFSVLSEEYSATGLFFKPDGSKMYIIGYTGREVNEYNLSTPWDISSANHLQLFDISSEGLSPQGLFFKPDGSKMYTAEYENKNVNEYNLSTPWDISSAVYSQGFNEEKDGTGLFFKPDGSKMYTAESTNDKINEYDLNVAWNISSASWLQDFYVGNEESWPRGVFFNATGNKMYVVGFGEDKINEYDLNVAWNISSASWLQDFYVGNEESSPRGVFFNATGNKMYVVGTGGDEVNEYDLLPDTTKPSYSNNQTNTTIAGQSTKFSIQYNDDTALHPKGQYIFSTNNTGTWTNESAVNFTATPSWANVTKTLNSTVGLSIGYRWYADDNIGNINNTEIFILTTTSADTCTYTSGNWNVDCSDNCTITSDVDLGGNNLTLSNDVGHFNVQANITNFNKIFKYNACEVRIKLGDGSLQK